MQCLWRILSVNPKWQDMDKFDEPLEYQEADVP